MGSRSVAVLAALCAAATAGVVASPAAAQPVAHTTVVSANPQDTLPRLPLGAAEQYVARAYAQVGPFMFVGGTFPAVNGGAARTNLAAMNATTGTLTSFAPRLNGVVNQLLPSPDGQLFVAGTFTAVNGINRRGVVKLTTSGAVTTLFNAGFLSGAVSDLQLVRGRLVVAGSFPGKLLALDPVTGRNTGYITVPVTGSIDPAAGPQRVERFAANPAGTRLVALGNFTAVAGQARRQAFMLNLSATGSSLAPWYSNRFDETCAVKVPFYLRDVDFTPDGGRFVLAATGAAAPQDVPANRRKLCDSASMWSAAGQTPGVEPLWINYTGGDSIYAVAATNAAIYVGGHMRWLNNPFGRNAPGGCAGFVCPVEVAGLGALDPATGWAMPWNPRREGRGHGVEVLLLTSRGLWAGGDTVSPGTVGCSTPALGGNCAGQPLEQHPGIVFFPR